MYKYIFTGFLNRHLKLTYTYPVDYTKFSQYQIQYFVAQYTIIHTNQLTLPPYFLHNYKNLQGIFLT